MLVSESMPKGGVMPCAHRCDGVCLCVSVCECVCDVVMYGACVCSAGEKERERKKGGGGGGGMVDSKRNFCNSINTWKTQRKS